MGLSQGQTALRLTGFELRIKYPPPLPDYSLGTYRMLVHLRAGKSLMQTNR